MRTIWVAIRGVNYSDRATRQVGKNIDELTKKQQILQRQMTMTFAAGVLYTIMAAMVGAAMHLVTIKLADSSNTTMLETFDFAAQLAAQAHHRKKCGNCR